jgi:uncharacterized membrane protein HdeD (DUF308 family)
MFFKSNDSSMMRMLGIIAIIAGILIIIFPAIIAYVIGIVLIIYGVLSLL